MEGQNQKKGEMLFQETEMRAPAKILLYLEHKDLSKLLPCASIMLPLSFPVDPIVDIFRMTL